MDGLGVQWTKAPDAAHGKAIRMDTRISEQAMQAQWVKTGLTNMWNIPKPEKNAIAETYGLSLYSDAIPVKPGQAYRITFDYQGPDGGAKVWVRGWGMFQGEKRRRWETYVTCHGKHRRLDHLHPNLPSHPVPSRSHRNESHALRLLSRGRLLVRQHPHRTRHRARQAQMTPRIGGIRRNLVAAFGRKPPLSLPPLASASETQIVRRSAERR